MSRFCQKVLVWDDLRLRYEKEKKVFNMDIERIDIKIFNKTTTITHT